MKGLYIIGSIVGALVLALFIKIVIDIQKMNHEETYRGVIIGHTYEPPTSGYKSHSDAKYGVILKDDKSGKGIRINVTVPTYYGLKDGAHTAFTLSNSDLHNYGNTTDATKNLYEQ